MAKFQTELYFCFDRGHQYAIATSSLPFPNKHCHYIRLFKHPERGQFYMAAKLSNYTVARCDQKTLSVNLKSERISSKVKKTFYLQR